MGKKNGWKNYLCEKLYCNPEWNRRLVCLWRSFEEVCRILNAGGSCEKKK